MKPATLPFRFVFVILVTICVQTIFAQGTKPVIQTGNDSVPTMLPQYHPEAVSPVWFVPSERDTTHKVAPKARRKTHKHFDLQEEYVLDSIKQVMRQKVLADTSAAKNAQDSEEQESPSLSVVNPMVGRNFAGNDFDGYRPPDNSMAISDEGWIVSIVNSNISFVDENGMVSLSSVSLDEYLEFLDLTSYYFDPKVIYDPVGDRFIMVALNGSSSSESKLVVAFSQSQDPNDGWWVYSFDGNFANANTWFDYPQIGLSTEDLYLTGNLYDNNDVFNQAVIIQLDKELGYVGSNSNLGFTYWSNVTNTLGQKIGGIQPVSGGYNSYGPGIYLISSRTSTGSSISLFNITADNGNIPQLQKYEVNCSSYNIGSDALQPGTSKLLSVNDCRIQSSFYQYPTIYYVHHNEYQNSGYNGIRYGRLNLTNLTITSSNFGISGATNSFPVIAPFSTTAGSSDVLIGYTRSSSTTYPQLRALTHDGTTYSSSITVKAGNSAITPSSDNVQRWGDYLGISRRRNATIATTWIYGNYGNNDTYGNWIAEIVPEGSVVEGTSCSQAIPITCGSSVNGSTQGSSQNVPDCVYTFNTAPGLWYKFTGTGDNVKFSTCSYANYDTKIAVYEGSCSNLLCVAGNDDDPSCGNKSSVGFT
ncbi:MAG: hypothetical protein IT270_14025, partial [Saprospiraceae bacterium]|nr:hypothetical protein [Saprospiraceae bacterium]